MQKVKKEVVKALSESDKPDAFNLGEMGYLANPVFSGVPIDELKQDLVFPASLNTFKQMQYHSAVASSIKLFELVVSKSEWRVKYPRKATKSEKKRADLVWKWLNEMQDQSFSDFLQSACSAYTYGFSIFEKVYIPSSEERGKIAGIKRLAFRNQRSVWKFLFSEDGNDITGVVQNISGLQDSFSRYNKKGNEVKLPRKKFLLLRVGQHNDSPVGRSPLVDAYVSWKFLTELEKIEAQGIARDLQGLPVKL